MLDTEKEDPVDIVLRALRILPGRVIDAFRVMDADMSGTIDRQEFRTGVSALLSKRRSDIPPPREVIDSLFERIDADASGYLSLNELDKVLRLGLVQGTEGAGPKHKGELQLKSKNANSTKRELGPRSRMKVTLDFSAMSPEDALRVALNENAVRVIDLFRDWDTDLDGMISRSEFIHGVEHFGFPGREAAGKLFTLWDKDGSGELSFSELNAVLRRGKEMAGGGWLAAAG